MMLTNIQSKTYSVPSVASEQVRDLLWGCHDRIRYFLSLAHKITRVNGAAGPEIASAAEKVVRYFTVALPLHEADENESLHPRMHASHPGPRITAAIDTMMEEHKTIDQVVDQLVPLWKQLQEDPKRLAELAPELAPLTEKLARYFDDHMRLEEEIIFPAVDKVLSQDQLSELAMEMKQRREAK